MPKFYNFGQFINDQDSEGNDLSIQVVSPDLCSSISVSADNGQQHSPWNLMQGSDKALEFELSSGDVENNLWAWYQSGDSGDTAYYSLDDPSSSGFDGGIAIASASFNNSRILSCSFKISGGNIIIGTIDALPEQGSNL